MRISILISMFLIVAVASSYGQQSLNIQLVDQIIRAGETRYSGSWTYVAPNGNEYALLGAKNGLVAYDLDNGVVEVGYVPGPSSNWREIAVVADHAYVTTEGSGDGQGMQVVSLNFLPDSLHLVTTYTTNFTKAHIIQTDIFNPSPYVYVNGITPGGSLRIIDVSNPATPVEVGIYDPYYIHDCHIRGNTMYASAVWNGTLDIVDITDKSIPTLITQISYPGSFTHSSSTTIDENYLFICDEVDGLPMTVWDISDLQNPVLVHEYTANAESLVHNPYVRGDYVFVSHNTEGLRVLDIADPSVPVEVGYYDTYSGPSGGFSGLWSAFPYLPSGKIIGGDRTGGLYVWEFNDTKAGRFYGEVKDSLTGTPIFNANIQLLENSASTSSDLLGQFKFGTFAGDYTIQCSADGYVTNTIEGISLIEGDSLWLVFELVSDSPTPVIDPDLFSDYFNIFPNPVQSFIEIVPNNNSIKDHIAELMDVTGRKILEKRISHNDHTIINTAGLAEGVYFLRISDSSGRLIAYEKIVKSSDL